VRPQVHAAYVLGLAITLAMAMSVHPRTSPPVEAGLIDLPIESTTIGPRCRLTAWSPDAAADRLWILPPEHQVLPYELVLAGYPDTGARPHRIVAQVTCTAYSSTRDQTDSTPCLTASMQPVGPGIIALSRDLLRRYTPGAPFDFGDHVEVVGVGIFRVEDTMHRRWQRRADIWVKSRSEAWQWGRREVLIGYVAPTTDLELFERSPVPVDDTGLEVELIAPAGVTSDPAASPPPSS
jgi:3D (Asp-Asp-Asp) domain-containing protein